MHGAFHMHGVSHVCVHKHVPVLSLCPAERSSVKALDTSLPAEAGCDKSALVQ